MLTPFTQPLSVQTVLIVSVQEDTFSRNAPWVRYLFFPDIHLVCVAFHPLNIRCLCGAATEAKDVGKSFTYTALSDHPSFIRGLRVCKWSCTSLNLSDTVLVWTGLSPGKAGQYVLACSPAGACPCLGWGSARSPFPCLSWYPVSCCTGQLCDFGLVAVAW